MDRLAESIRYYIYDRMHNDPAWAGLKVVFSDASAPGEGEHKIMEFIRLQRAQPDYNPSTHHVLHGLDADLIMLGTLQMPLHSSTVRDSLCFTLAAPAIARQSELGNLSRGTNNPHTTGVCVFVCRCDRACNA